MDSQFLQPVVRILDKIPTQVIFWGSILTLIIVLIVVIRKLLNLRGE